jgi:IS5 family transposase
MRQTKKGNQWHFGMTLHIGADSLSGLVHRAVVTGANVHDKHPLPYLLHGSEKRVYGDRGYQGCTTIIKAAAPQARDFTNRRVRAPARFQRCRKP